MSFKFGKNGGKTVPHVSHLIDVATDPSTQTSENWTLFMEICDVINSAEDGPKDAVKAVRKKFATRNPQTTALTLTLLEAFVKNCGKRFHMHIATKDFLQDFIKIISPKYSPSIELQMRVLGLLQTWAYAFQSAPELKEVGKQYQELKNKGVEFPQFDADKATQAHIPAKRSTMSPNRATCKGGPRPAVNATSMSGTLTPDHLAKLHSELNTVTQNCRVFGEMLTELKPGQENQSDMELLEDLNMTCRQMQKRIMELIQVVQVEEVTVELLQVNDELNNVFLRYDRYQRNQPRSKPMQPSAEIPNSALYFPPPQPPQSMAMPVPTPGYTTDTPYPPVPNRSSVPVDNLIDLGDTPSPRMLPPSYPGLEAQFTGMSMQDGTQHPGSRDEFSFASSAETNVAAAPRNTESGRDSDFAEMEKWLMENTGEPGAETATSSEFDRFLSERARDADRLPVTNAAPGHGPGTGKKDDGAPLFSL